MHIYNFSMLSLNFCLLGKRIADAFNAVLSFSFFLLNMIYIKAIIRIDFPKA